MVSVGLVGGPAVKTVSGSLDPLHHSPHPSTLTANFPSLECVVAQRLCLLIPGPILYDWHGAWHTVGAQQMFAGQMNGQVDL